MSNNQILKNNQNLETLAGGERLQTVPSGQYYLSTGDPIARDQNGPDIFLKYNLLLNKNYGFLRNNENKCLSVSGPPGSCDETNKNQLFTLTTDGRLFNYGDNKFRTSKLCVDLNGDKGRIFISEIRPRPGNDISLWTNQPISALTNDFIEKSWFNEPLAGPGICWERGKKKSCDCEAGAGDCPPRQTQIRDEYLPGKAIHRRWCLLTEWPAENEAPCSDGDKSIKDPNNGKLDLYKCKNLHETQVCDEPFKPSQIGKTTGVWAPWSQATADSDLIVDFCSQHDSYKNVPFLDSTSSYPNCNAWCTNQENRTDGKKNRCKDAKAKYCSKYTSDLHCVDYCKNSDICGSALKTFCQGDNLKAPVCQNYCNQPGVTCDAELEKFCQGLCVRKGDMWDCSAAIGPDTKNICGCFLPVDFYSEISDAIMKRYNLPNFKPDLKQCYYPFCSQSNWKPYLERHEKTKCPDVNACIQISNIDISGHFDGDININNNIASCGDITAKPTNCKVLTQFSNLDGKCEDCPANITVPKISSKFIKTCLCANDKYVFDQKTKTCKPCPSGTMLNEMKDGCRPCPPGATSNEDGCISCPSNQFLNSATNACENCKEPDQVQDKTSVYDCVNIATTCPDGQFYDKSLNPAKCNTCPPGKKPSSNKKTCENLCNIPKFYDPNTASCISCDPSLTYDVTLEKCVSCNSGQIPNEGGIGCKNCDTGYVVSSDKTKCIPSGEGGSGFWNKYKTIIILVIVIILLLLCSSLGIYFFKKK